MKIKHCTTLLGLTVAFRWLAQSQSGARTQTQPNRNQIKSLSLQNNANEHQQCDNGAKKLKQL